MGKQMSIFHNLYLKNMHESKFILFTFLILISSLFYINESFAINENNKKLILNGSSRLFDNDNNNTLVSGHVFSKITNITNNNYDSNEKNYEVYLKKSEDQGNTFSKAINLSNNSGFSEHPQIAVSKNGIFIVWADNTNSNNTEIMFTKSLDNGTTFGKIKNLSNNSKDSNNQEISVSDQNVYVVWQDIDKTDSSSNKKNLKDKEISSSISFRGSTDKGNTFNDEIEITNNTYDSYPKVNSFKNYVYVVWNSENKSSSKDYTNTGLFFIKSSDYGKNFDNSIRLVNDNFGESQISVVKDELVIVWGGLHSKSINNIYFVQSEDNGITFKAPSIILQKDTKPNYNNYSDRINNPSNVEIANDDHSYAVWQDIISQENQDIFLGNIKNSTQSIKIINLSNNSGISECPSIAISNNNIYVIWEDFTPGNHEILFTKGALNSNYN